MRLSDTESSCGLRPMDSWSIKSDPGHEHVRLVLHYMRHAQIEGFCLGPLQVATKLVLGGDCEQMAPIALVGTAASTQPDSGGNDRVLRMHCASTKCNVMRYAAISTHGLVAMKSA